MDNVYLIIGIITAALLVLVVIRGLWRIGSSLQSLVRLFHQAFKEAPQQAQPRSLSGYEPTLIPLIRRDFPDFDPQISKNKVRDYLREQFREHKDLKIHNVVISQYLTDSLQRTIVFQAAVGWRDSAAPVEKRYDIHCSYLLPQKGFAIAANCPNCGATLGFGEVECPYCGSRVVNPLSQKWEFTQLEES